MGISLVDDLVEIARISLKRDLINMGYEDWCRKMEAELLVRFGNVTIQMQSALRPAWLQLVNGFDDVDYTVQKQTKTHVRNRLHIITELLHMFRFLRTCGCKLIKPIANMRFVPSVCIISSLLLGASCAVPPWYCNYSECKISRTLGYYPIWRPPIPGSHRFARQMNVQHLSGFEEDYEYFNVRIDKDRLTIEVIGILLITLGLLSSHFITRWHKYIEGDS